MITIFNQGLIYWTGILTGLFFVFNFLGCRHIGSAKSRLFGFAKRRHYLAVYLTLGFFLLHLVLAILSRNFKIII